MGQEEREKQERPSRKFVWVLTALLLSITVSSFLNASSPNLLSAKIVTQDLGASTSPWLDSLLRSDAQLAPIIQNADKYELQIIYTQIDRDDKNLPRFTEHDFHLNARQYFDPASLVKLPTAIVALEKLKSLRAYGVTRNSPMATGVAHQCQTAVPYAAAADSDYQHTVGNYIKRMLLVSDNNAYNRLYEFVGQRPLNERLTTLGYPQSRIVRRFAPCDTAANRYTNPISFYSNNGKVIYSQPAVENSKSLDFPLGRITKGSAYRVNGKLIRQPYDFTTANLLSLQDITSLLKSVMFPSAVSGASQFDLSEADYRFLHYYLRSTPHQSGFKPFRADSYFDTYKKYLYYGRNTQVAIQPGLHIHNIVGMSHGYLSDVAYFADSTRQVEFLLSCVLYVNKDGIINDGIYEYTSVGLPFLSNLGKLIYRYELKRPKRH